MDNSQGSSEPMSPRKHQSVWDALEGLRDSHPVSQARSYAHQLEAARERRRRTWANVHAWTFPRFAVGALVTLGLAATAVVLWRPADRLQTNIGEIRTVTLADGSTVMLNTDTQIEFNFTDKERRVRLVNGEARFDVAHNTSRPFRVSAGPVVVTAVGTAFDVATLQKRTTVTLIEGKVLVEAKAQGDRPVTTTLSPGDQLMVAPDGHVNSNPNPNPNRIAKLDAAIAWQQSLVDINDETLADALAEINRYSETKVVLRDRSLLDRRISGQFRTGDVEAFAAALNVYFGLQVVDHAKDKIVLDRPN